MLRPRREPQGAQGPPQCGASRLALDDLLLTIRLTNEEDQADILTHSSLVTRQLAGDALCLAPDPQRILTPNLLDVRFRIAAPH